MAGTHAKGVRDGAGKIPGSPERGVNGAGPGLSSKARQGAGFNQRPATILGLPKGNMLRHISLSLCQKLHAIQMN